MKILLYLCALFGTYQIHAQKQIQLFVDGIPLKGIEDVLPQTVRSRSDFVTNITNKEGPFGTYRGMGFCPPGTWAVGFNQRVQESQGRGDDTALNSVYLLCADAQGHYVDNARSYDGLFGTWALTSICQGPLDFLTCFNIRVEDFQFLGDDTAANDVTMTCASGEVLSAGNGGTHGTWGHKSCCPPQTAICGINVKFESFQGNGILGDDTGMNGATMACCTIPTFAPTKSPTTVNGRDDLFASIANWEVAQGNYAENFTFCPPLTWVAAFSLKYDSNQTSVDRTAVNGVTLTCTSSIRSHLRQITSQEGPNGVPTFSTACPGTFNFVECYQVRLQPNQADQGPSFDNTAVNDVRMTCLDNTLLTAPQTGTEGFWSSPVCCPLGSAVCGLNVKLQKFQGPGHQGENDDMAMTGLKLACCKFGVPKLTLNIQFLYPNSGAPPSLVAAFQNAAIRWQRSISSAFPTLVSIKAGTKCGSYVFPQDTTVDDLLVIVRVAPLEPIYGPAVAAVTGICIVDEFGQIRLGFTEVASEQLNDFVRDGELNSIAEHHIGHQLGIGTLWASRGFVTSNFKYSGVQGSVQSQAVGGPVPAVVEDQGGSLGRGKHWEEGTYGTELMTAFQNHIPYNQISRVSLGALIDLGFTVDLKMADPYHVDQSSLSAGRNLRRTHKANNKVGKTHYDIVLTDEMVMVQSFPKPGHEMDYEEKKRELEEQQRKRKKNKTA